MHCPRCGQQQVSNEIKFCSRCGLPLEIISEVLAHDGFLPQLAELNQKKVYFTKKNGVIFSFFWMMFFLLIMTPFFGIVDVDELAAISAVIGIFGGIMMMFASMVFLKSSNAKTQSTQSGFTQMPNAQPNNIYQTNVNALPPPQSQPVSSYAPPPAAGLWKAPDTGELVPNSVTENTTKLLQKDEK